MSKIVTIVDYGVGNLLSIARAVERVGAEARVTGDPKEVAEADRLVLPGVGAFGHCAENLRSTGLSDPVASFARTGRPFLGICVGMQLLFDFSTEFGHHAGLGLIPGSVDIIPTDSGGITRKVPHVGWSILRMGERRESWTGTPLGGIGPESCSAYFVHSYSSRPTDGSDVLAVVDYEGAPICAAVQRENLTGVQFHPEKSGPVGLSIFESFLSI